MSDIKLTADGRDIDLSTGDIQIIDGPDAIAQHMMIRLRFVKGEHHLDVAAGVPYFEDILGKGKNPVTAESLLRETILETPGVLSIASFDFSFIAVTRSVVVTGSVMVVDSDELLDFSEAFSVG